MKSLPWLRLYHEIIDDDRIISIAFEDRWHYVALMCCKAKGILDRNQSEEQLIRALCAKLGIDRRTLDEVHRRLVDVGLIEHRTFQPIAWNKRQFVADADPSNARRQKELRDRRKAGVDDLLRNQGGDCDCCSRPFETPYSKYVCLDHDHKNGRARALVCQSCNKLIGQLENNQRIVYEQDRRMVEAYVERHAAIHATEDRNVTVTSLDADTDDVSPNGDTSRRVRRGGHVKHEYTPDFEEAWALYPDRPGMNKLESFKAWNARLNHKDPQQRFGAQQMIDGTRRYAHYCVAMGTEPRFIKQPSTFYGPAAHFMSAWEFPAPSLATSGGARVSKHDQRAAFLDGLTNPGDQHDDPPGDFIDVDARRVG